MGRSQSNQSKARTKVERTSSGQEADDRSSLPTTHWTVFVRGLFAPYLAVLWSHVIELNLSPVYGSIPAGLWSKEFVTYAWPCIVIGVTVILYLLSPSVRSVEAIRSWLPIASWASACALHGFLYCLSSSLGPVYGVVTTKVIVQLPVSVMAAIAVAYPLLRTYPLPLLVLLAYTPRLLDMQNAIDSLLNRIGPVGNNIIASRVGLLAAVSAAWSLICLPLTRGTLFRFGLVSACGIVYLLVLNPHGPFALNLHFANNQLKSSEFILLERVESNTGYISVLENQKLGYRALRCDHSLLGGNWLVTAESIMNGMTQSESIFSVFTTLEAVRLMAHDTSNELSSTPAALFIGLGIGTAPAAFARHGIDTVVVELDPEVIRMAQKYFELPANVTVHDENAQTFILSLPANHYDYIVHDVFTGGAEPIQLFTVEFLTSLKRLLRPDGFIAINYAGDLKRKSTWRVLRTIDHVFQNCKVFRDSEQTSGVEEDFANFVLFCSRNSTPWSFRRPVEADFLGSLQRREWLVPRFEVPFTRDSGAGLLSSHDESSQHELIQHHQKSAADHWRIMRKVMPDNVWETW